MGSAVISNRTIAQWRAHTQHLSSPTAQDPADVVRALLGMQAERMDHTAWALAVRCADVPGPERIEELVGTTLIRTHTLRTTWYLVHVDDLGWVMRLTRPRLRRLIDNQLRSLGVDGDELERSIGLVAQLVADRGPQRRSHLVAALSEAGHRSDGLYASLVAEAAEIDLVLWSGPRRDGHHTYDLVPRHIRDEPTLDEPTALARLALRYMTGHGPATEGDLAYWATLTRRAARGALQSVRDQLETFEHDGQTYFHAPDSAPPSSRASAGRVHILHLFDETYRGYQASRHVIEGAGQGTRQRESALGIVLVNGQLAARHGRQLTDDEVVFTVDPLRPLTAGEVQRLHRRAAQYGRWLQRTPSVRIRQ